MLKNAVVVFKNVIADIAFGCLGGFLIFALDYVFRIPKSFAAYATDAAIFSCIFLLRSGISYLRHVAASD